MTGSAPLISPEELLERLRDPDSHRTADPTVLLDVRWQLGGSDGREQYRSGHLPGAAYVELDTDLADPPGAGGRHPLPDPERFATAMRRLGVSRDRPVVAYDDASGMAAARAWWLLRYHGHLDVRLLDGGWPAWLAAGGPVQTGDVTPAPGTFDARPGQLPTVEAEAVLDLAASGLLIDARAPERYAGAAEPVDPVAGHIPGAVNLPVGLAVEPEGPRAGRLKDPQDLAELYAEARRRPDQVAVYCGSGVTAAFEVMALELVGVRAALFPGSWSEWITDPTRPVAAGPG